MFRRLLTSILVTVMIASATILVWAELKSSNHDRVSRITTAESRSARSNLSNDVETLFSALRNVRHFWATFGYLPRDKWSMDASIELSHFKGLKLLIWNDPERDVRYIRSASNSVFDHRPDEDEWRQYQKLLDRANQHSGNTITGPFPDDDGNFVYEIFMERKSDPEAGMLVAVVDFTAFFEHVLKEVSPGYAMNIRDAESPVYVKGDEAEDIPEDWQSEFSISTSLDRSWSVRHAPEAELMESFASPAISIILLLGVVISILMGSLAYENSRAHSRERSALSAEAEVKELNLNLEDRVAAGLKTLSNRTADLEVITDSVAHDLRNPLNTISVNAQLLEAQLEGKLTEKEVAALQRISPAISQMDQILDRLLGLSSVHNRLFEREWLSLADMSKALFESLSASEPPPPIELRLDTMPDAFADKTLVEMLLRNLLSNAIKYTRSNDQRMINIGAITQETGTTYYVRDNGIGFDEEASERLFLPYHRESEAKLSDGLGLGLMIVARVIERHDGTIWAESKPGSGATFFFTLEP